MPWVHGEDYSKQKNAELKHLLQLRNLPYSGTKEKMASRLIAHDSEQSVLCLLEILADAEDLLTSLTALFPSRDCHRRSETKSTS